MRKRDCSGSGLSPQAKKFYRGTMDLLDRAKVSFLVGGAFAFRQYTGISRDTKDIDFFLMKADVPAGLEALRRGGLEVETTDPGWLAKATHGHHFADLIFSSGNGLCPVDSAWFDHSREGRILGHPVRLVPPEEMIWQKAFIMERERFDGADIAHLLFVCRKELDWHRLRNRFAGHWMVLLAHLVMFGYIYPRHHQSIPRALLDELLRKWSRESPAPATGKNSCRGPFLSRTQYTVDLKQWGLAMP